MASSHTIPTSDGARLSELYLSCSGNEVKRVKRLLRNATLAQINRMELNGSTALHVACHRNHVDIVQLLLERGACRSILNSHNLTPYDEATDENVKKLFHRDDRYHFISPYGAVTWSIRNPPTWDAIRAMNTYLERELYTVGLLTMLEHLRTHYLPHIGLSGKQHERINWFFNQAITEENFVPIIRAYTTPTKFYKVVNEHFARILAQPIRIDPLRRSLNTSVYYLASILTFSSQDDIPPVTYDTFRGLILSKNELKKYRRGDIIVNTAAVSTSTNRKVADMFAGEGQGQNLRHSNNKNHKLQVGVILRYKFCINTTRSMQLSKVSEFQNEDEVLIKPLTLFKVIAIRQPNSKNADLYEIDLEECNLNSVDGPDMYNINLSTNNITSDFHDNDDFGISDSDLNIHFDYRIPRNRETRSEYIPIPAKLYPPSISQSDDGRYLLMSDLCWVVDHFTPEAQGLLLADN